MFATHRRPLVTFGTFEVDLDAGEIRKSGIRIRLAGQPFRVLVMLLSRPGEVITRDELQREIWGTNTNVDFERGIASTINKVRDALGDSAEHPLYIETLSRRGYRFIAPVSNVSEVFQTASEIPVLEPGLPSASQTPISSGTPSGFQTDAAESRLPEPVRSRGSSILQGLVYLLPCLALIAGASGISYRLARGVAPPPPPAIRRLTLDDRIDAGLPNPEISLVLESDGPRIYAPILTDGHSQTSALNLSGTQVEIVNVPDELRSAAVTDISRDGSKLIVRSRDTREPEQPLWIVPTAGSGALRVGEVLAHDAVWMPNDSGSVLYANGAQLGVVQLDTGAVAPYASLSGRAFWLRWSPDGKTLRYSQFDPLTHTSSLWELDAASKQLHRLSFKGLQDSSVCCGSWTPSGKLFVFQAFGPGGSNIWAAGAGYHPVLLQLTNGPLPFSSPLPSRDEHSVYAFASSEPSGTRIYDPRHHQFLPAPQFLSEAQRVSFSRNRKWVAWTDASDRLWRARWPDGSGLLRLTGDDLEVYLAHWSSDGQQLLVMARTPGKTWEIDTVSANGGAIHRILSDTRNLADPDWSPDGQQIVFGREADLMGKESGVHNLQIFSLQTNQTEAIPGSADLFSPRWSPDGRYVAALSRDQTRLLVFDFAHRSWQTLFNGGVADPVWSPDSKNIYFHAFAQPNSSILSVSVSGELRSISDLSTAGLAFMNNPFFSGVTPDGSPIVKPRIGTGNLYSITLPDVR